MSTNYYLMCECCNQEIKHLGKTSNNVFLSNLTEKELHNLIDNIKENQYIQNEYGEKILSGYIFFQRIPDRFELVQGNFC